MNILYLGPTSPLIRFLEAGGDHVVQTEDRIDFLAEDWKFDFLISYGYRHILRPQVLALFPNRAINLHIGYLPWNRGADPNLWSWIDGTPKGVAIHHLDEGIDTGDIIAGRLVTMGAAETLSTSYAKLRLALEGLFIEMWPSIKAGAAPRVPQPKPARRSRDRATVQRLLTQGWETPVASLASTQNVTSGFSE